MVYTLHAGEVDAPRSVGQLFKFTYRESAAYVREVTCDFFYPQGEIEDSPGYAFAMIGMLSGGFVVAPVVNFGIGVSAWYKAARHDRQLDEWRKAGRPLRVFNPDENLEGNIDE